MEWLEWLLSREFRQFILNHDLFIPLLFLARVIFVTAIELIAPARKISYRSVILYDLIGCTLVGYILIPASQFLSNRIALRASVPEVILALPVAASFFLYYVVGDFGAYWMHRLIHAKPVWRAHKWHHSPTTMYWLAGYRASLPQQTLFNLPWIFAYPVFGLSPWWMYLAVLSSHMLLNDWMHMNVSWRSNWLEWIMVTPRYHHIHHSDDPAYYNANFGVTFTIWDRIFGTYVDPETVKQPISFGIGEQVPLVRLIAGV
jgi:sterol desaturase/sphingolipid hydroxylase (fatty acid hydroxylase superfamily)